MTRRKVERFSMLRQWMGFLAIPIWLTATPIATAAETCQINFDVIRNMDKPQTAGEAVEGVAAAISANASNLQIYWSLQDFEAAEMVTLSEFFGGQGHLFDVIVEEEATSGLPYRLLAVEHHGRGRTPLSTLTSSYTATRVRSAESRGYRISPRSFLIWYTAENGAPNVTCFSSPNSARLREEADKRAAEFNGQDALLRKRLAFVERAAAWDALARASLQTVQSRETRNQLAALDQSRLGIAEEWSTADDELQRELARQRRLRSDAGFIAIMQTLLSAAQLADALSSQAKMSPAGASYDGHRPIRTQINEALITSGGRITRIKTQIEEYERRSTSLEHQLRKTYRGAGVPNKSIP